MSTRKGLRNKRKLKRSRRGGAAAAAAAAAVDRLAEVRLAAHGLNAMLNPSDRAIVKRRLQILYGTSETWKKLRNGNNAAGFVNAEQYNDLPDDVKIALASLCDRIRQVFEQPYGVAEYTGIILILVNNNLYKKTQQQMFNNNNNNNDDMSNGWSNAGNNNSIHNMSNGNEENPQ